MCLQSAGHPMPFYRGASLSWKLVQLWNPCVSIWVAPMTMPCSVLGQPLLLGCHMHIPLLVQRHNCQLPFSDGRMQLFLHFRLASHQVPVVVGHFAGGQHVARADRVCTRCGSVAVVDEIHMILECPALHALRQQYAPLFCMYTNTMHEFLFLCNNITCKGFKFVSSCLSFFQV